MFTVSLGGVACREGVAAQEVLAVGDGFEVLGVHAAADPAQMIRDQAFREFASEHPVGEPMGLVVLATELESPVPVTVVGARRPKPTPRLRINPNLSPESIRQPGIAKRRRSRYHDAVLSRVTFVEETGALAGDSAGAPLHRESYHEVAR
jgi:hypothetical protein